MAVYLDASAGVKLVMEEAESAPLRRWLRDRPVRFSSSLFRTEVLRAARRVDLDMTARARRVVGRITLVAIDDSLLISAADLEPPALRSLDAIHLATAVRLGDQLEAIVTYDRRMAEGATLLGLPIASPA